MNPADLPEDVRDEVSQTLMNLGFFPNALKEFLDLPWATKHFLQLNRAIMADSRNLLHERLKRRMALAASEVNHCDYCVAHHKHIIARQSADRGAGLSIARPEIDSTGREAIAIEFVRQASKDPTNVPIELRRQLLERFSRQEVMEIIMTIGFWKMMNTMNSVLGVPIEEHLLPGATDQRSY